MRMDGHDCIIVIQAHGIQITIYGDISSNEMKTKILKAKNLIAYASK